MNCFNPYVHTSGEYIRYCYQRQQWPTQLGGPRLTIRMDNNKRISDLSRHSIFDRHGTHEKGTTLIHRLPNIEPCSLYVQKTSHIVSIGTRTKRSTAWKTIKKAQVRLSPRSHRSDGLHSKFLRLHFQPNGSTPTTLSRAER